MQTLFDSAKKRALLSSGFSMVMDNKRYIVWFYVLNAALAFFGTSTFSAQARSILDHSLLSERLVHGFDVSIFGEMLTQPDFGPMQASVGPATGFAVLFFILTALFLPGIFQGYASTCRLPREDFFRACGRNLWRFIRLMIVAGIVMGIFAGVLFMINGAIAKKAVESTNELLPFELNVIGLAVIFLVMTTLRIWFDLAEADIVLNDQRAVRKSIARAFRHTFRSLSRLLTSYVVVTVIAAIFLVAGIWAWMKFIAPENVAGAFFVSQLTLLLLLIPRFWERGVAVSYWQQNMLVVPVVATEAVAATPVALPSEVMAEPIGTETVASRQTTVPEMPSAQPETPTVAESTGTTLGSSKAEPQ